MLRRQAVLRVREPKFCSELLKRAGDRDESSIDVEFNP